MPLGDFPSADLEHLVGYYRAKYGLTIETLPSVPLEPVVLDQGRQQLIAEELITLMKGQHPGLANDPEAILIGITAGDMYIRGYAKWRWAFAFREGGRFAVISSAPMDPRIFPPALPFHLLILKGILESIGIRLDDVPDPELLRVRLRKMVSRTIGFLYFRLPQRADRKSVMYGPILGVNDLDSIGDDF